jgi:hypothetical protein
MFESFNNYFVPVHGLLKTQTVYKYILKRQAQLAAEEGKLTKVA